MPLAWEKWMPTWVLKGRLSGENRVSRYIRKSEPRGGARVGDEMRAELA